MGLIDKLRKAEEQGREAARHAFERAREMGDDVQRRIRQRMRIYPKTKSVATPSEVNQGQPVPMRLGLDEPDDASKLEVSQPRSIVSVHGKDVPTEKKPPEEGRRIA